MTAAEICLTIGLIIGTYFGFVVGAVTVGDILEGGIRMGKTPEKYMLKIDFRKFFHGGVVPERFKYPRPEATTTEGWEKKTSDEIITDIQAIREKIENIRPSPVAYAGKKAYEAIKKSAMYDPHVYGIEEADTLPEDVIYIPAKGKIIKFTGE